MSNQGHDFAEQLAQLDGWSGDRSGIHKTYRGKDFVAAMEFMRAAIDDIEAQGHHPEWRNVYNTVSVSLRTHDADDQVTDKDFRLAATLDRIAAAQEMTAVTPDP